jgi:hypothetical protein
MDPWIVLNYGWAKGRQKNVKTGRGVKGRCLSPIHSTCTVNTLSRKLLKDLEASKEDK